MNKGVLISKEEYLERGHRACIGCGEMLAVRQVCKALGKDVIITTATGCIEIVSSALPFTSWRVPWIHTLFENTAAVASGIESAYKALIRKGKRELAPEKKIKIVAFAGDGATSDIGIQALSGALERWHNFLFCCFDNEAYMNCLPASSLIMTEDGLKSIVEVKIGEKVYAFDYNSNELTLKRCVSVLYNGIRKIFELRTSQHRIEATPNHPFLVLKRNGRGRKNELVWKTLAEIKLGDMVVVLKDLDEGKSYKFNPIKKTVVSDYKVTPLNEELPDETNTDLMKYLGIYVGDGWTRVKKGEVGFSLPEGTKGRKILMQLHSKIFGNHISEDDMYIYVHSVNLAKFINNFGFGSGVKNKTIPGWVFTLPKEEKESFVQGLLLSDGYKTGNSLRYVSASKELLKRLRLLLQTMGYRVGKIHEQRKERYKNFLIESEHFEIEEVKEVRPASRAPVFDLHVEDEHNFIADGVVVHNTGIQRSSSTPYGASTTTSPAGKRSIGQITWKKNMPEIAVAHGIPYVATACPSYPYDLMQKVKKAASIKAPSYIHILSPCPTGWRHAPNIAIKVGRLAVETGVFPIYEFENGVYRMNIDIGLEELKPVKEYLKLQRRFAHLTEETIEHIQKRVIEEYAEIKKKAEGG